MDERTRPNLALPLTIFLKKADTKKQLVGEENDVEYRLEDRRVQVGDLLREHQDVVGHSLVAASPSV